MHRFVPFARVAAGAFAMKAFLPLAAFAFAAVVQAQAVAPLAVQNAWVRPSVPGQSGTGAYMTLTAREPLTLLGVATPIARVAEIHEMRLEGDVMRMRALPSLELPAGKAVELKPGGHHLMLMDLQAALKPGTQVPVTLRLRDASGATRTVEVSVPVAMMPPAGAAAPHGHKH